MPVPIYPTRGTKPADWWYRILLIVGTEAGYYSFTSAPNEFVPFEEAVRKYKRKWDNVKIRAESFKRSRPKQKLSNAGFWSISVRKTERLDDNSGSNLSFGIVVTLKSLDGRNRIEDFIQQSIHLGWDVREINIEEKIRVNLESQQEITFE